MKCNIRIVFPESSATVENLTTIYCHPLEEYSFETDYRPRKSTAIVNHLQINEHLLYEMSIDIEKKLG